MPFSQYTFIFEFGAEIICALILNFKMFLQNIFKTEASSDNEIKTLKHHLVKNLIVTKSF